MLRAVAVYEFNDEENKFSLIKSSKIKSGFFAPRDLEQFEENILPIITKNLVPDKIYNKPFASNFHYAKWTPETKHLQVVIASRELKETAPGWLLINVRHVDEETVKATLDDIRVNYIGYIADDILIKRRKDQVAAVKAELIKNMEAALLRGQILEQLEPEALDLKENSIKLGAEATDLKNSYTCCGGARSMLPWK